MVKYLLFFLILMDNAYAQDAVLGSAPPSSYGKTTTKAIVTWICTKWENLTEPKLTGRGHSFGGPLYMNNFSFKACISDKDGTCDENGSYLKVSLTPFAKFYVSFSSVKASIMTNTLQPGEKKIIEFRVYSGKKDIPTIDLTVRACTDYSIVSIK